jgi:hypothetical protein
VDAVATNNRRREARHPSPARSIRRGDDCGCRRSIPRIAAKAKARRFGKIHTGAGRNGDRAADSHRWLCRLAHSILKIPHIAGVIMVASYQLGVNAYVVKPVDFHEFVNAIRELGVFWAVINQPPPGSIKR